MLLHLFEMIRTIVQDWIFRMFPQCEYLYFELTNPSTSDRTVKERENKND